MAKRPPERYNPGELQRTRANLGELSGEDAGRMMKLLGGEIGVERTDGLIEDKYKKLQDLNRRKSDRIVYSSGAGEVVRTEAYTASEASPRPAAPRYLDRVRMNFVAARQEYGVMTLSRAFASLFSFMLPVEEYVNPRFVLKGDEIFFGHIERLVLSVRALLSINQRYPINRIHNAFFIQILSVLKNWDIEWIHRELTYLQIAPRHLTFRHCGALTRKLLAPLVMLLDIAQGSAVPQALKHLYDLDIVSLPARHRDIQKIKDYYSQATTEYEYVFNVVSRRCYPLLMKLACSAYSPVDMFYMQQRAQILLFFELSEEDVLQLPGKPQIREAEEPEEVEVVPAAAGHIRLLEAPALRKGFEILERLFPGAGWNSLEDFPDLYPYFQPLIGFPRGFELVPPENSLHQTIVLASILQELFRGFRTIEFGFIQTTTGENKQLGRILDLIADSWRVFIDELIAGHYLGTLYEYCRNVEKNPHFNNSIYGSKQRDYLDWLGKIYVFPHLVMGRPRPPETVYPVGKLYELTAELRYALSAVAGELAGPDGADIKTVKKPHSEMVFEIDNEISRRFKHVLKIYGEETSNAHLLLYTYSILLILDTLLNEPGSHFYPYPSERIYRNEGEGSTVPMYSVPLVDPARYFREADRSVQLSEAPPPSREPEIKDNLTDLFNTEGLARLVDAQFESYRKKKVPFVILSVLLTGFAEYCEKLGEEAGVAQLKRASEIITSTIREYRDTPARIADSLFMVLLPETVRDEAVHLAIRLFLAFQEFEKLKIPVSIGIVQSERTWGREKIMKTARQAAGKAADLPSPSLCLYDAKQNSFKALSEIYGSD
ncbi:MAG: GGDEF domain-containing protein [Spirochaetales bacterium]|nr:GGDEF domain-containing protein [Spirochaetales bacterium]